MDHQLFFSHITETSQVAEARRLAVQLATQLGFNEKEAGKVAIVITEAATNLVKHATNGRLIVRALTGARGAGIEILALDQGPGITNIGNSLRDGYSTTGSPGTGLGAMMRLSTRFDIHSLPGKGTALLAQLWRQGPKRSAGPSSSLEVGLVCLPKPGEIANGDGWGIEQQDHRCLIMLVDGLGHGPAAATAAQAATVTLSTHSRLSPAAMIEKAHAALQPTRGAALAIVEINSSESLKFSGIGNIAGTVLTLERDYHLASHNGIVGHQITRIQEFVYPWPAKALLVLHSDGLATRWDLKAYPGLLERHPSLIAGVLYRDFQRGYDDVTVLVVKA
jgi:anti-sigma regulatory factor (Ser/Thr protein kinase)